MLEVLPDFPSQVVRLVPFRLVRSSPRIFDGGMGPLLACCVTVSYRVRWVRKTLYP